MSTNPALDPDDFIALEMDDSPARASASDTSDELFLDMTAGSGETQRCINCSTPGVAVDERGRCQACAADHSPAADLGGIAAESASNAAVSGAGSLRGGQLAGVGFTSKEGYITAIRNGVKAGTHASYLTTLRTRYGLTTADIAALNLPGPMVESALPVGDGMAHVPAGHVEGSAGIFDRQGAARAFKVGDAPVEYQALKPADLKAEKLVAVARSEGNGVVIAWNGRRSLKRADLAAALEKINASDLMLRANSARAQAGRTVGALNALGYVVRAERRVVVKAGDTTAVPTYDARWTIGRMNHAVSAEVYSQPDGSTTPAEAPLGKRVLQVTLTDDALSFVGDAQLAQNILDGYQTRLGEELYQSGDITTWLGGILRKHCDSIAFGALGWYVPAKHAARASEICSAVASTGFGTGWVLPGLPVTDSDMLRDGILRGLTDEVDGLMDRLTTERAAAKETRERGDIGQKRAGTFLADLRKIGERVVAYGVVLGDDRVATARERIRLAVADLEQLLGDDHTGISARFSAVWEEIEIDRKRAGGTL